MANILLCAKKILVSIFLLIEMIQLFLCVVFVFKAPGPFTGQYNSFIMERVFHGSFDETTCLDWTFDSEILAIGCKDSITRLYPLKKYFIHIFVSSFASEYKYLFCRWANFTTQTLGSHTDTIVACFFEKNNYDITTIGKNGQTCVWECTVEPKDLHPINAPQKKKAKVFKNKFLNAKFIKFHIFTVLEGGRIGGR